MFEISEFIPQLIFLWDHYILKVLWHFSNRNNPHFVEVMWKMKQNEFGSHRPSNTNTLKSGRHRCWLQEVTDPFVMIRRLQGTGKRQNLLNSFRSRKEDKPVKFLSLSQCSLPLLKAFITIRFSIFLQSWLWKRTICLSIWFWIFLKQRAYGHVSSCPGGILSLQVTRAIRN